MISPSPEEHLVNRLVTYTLDLDGRFIVVEHVPARVNEETGERFFSPQTVERLQRLAREKRPPDRMMQTPVFDFAAWAEGRRGGPCITPFPGRQNRPRR